MQRLELTQKEVALPLNDFAHEVVDVVVPLVDPELPLPENKKQIAHATPDACMLLLLS